MSAPNPKEGLQAKAKADIQTAITMLEQNLKPDVFMVDGPEWKQLYTAIKSLKKIAGDQQSKEVGMAGVKQIMSAMGPKGMGAMGAPKPPAPQGMPMAGPAPAPMAGLMSVLGGGGGGG